MLHDPMEQTYMVNSRTARTTLNAIVPMRLAKVILFHVPNTIHTCLVSDFPLTSTTSYISAATINIY